jgi:purine-nucleoside phosphorylase
VTPPTPHLAAEPGEVADLALLPGDPRRAEFFARHLLADVHRYNDVRNMTGLTGTYRGRRVSVQGTGMGIPSIAIYAAELFGVHGVRAAVRVGTCGSMQPHVGLHDIVVATGAHTDSAFNRRRMAGLDFAACADFALAAEAVRLCAERGIPHHAGTVYSSDRYYSGKGGDPAWDVLVEHGTLGVEMEAAGLYAVAAEHGARALCLTTVTDGVAGVADLSSLQREEELLRMAEVALDVLVG